MNTTQQKQQKPQKVTKEMREAFSDVIYSISHNDKYETVLKEVIETGKQEELQLVLKEYVEKRELEIQEICNSHYQHFLSCTENLGNIKEGMEKTQTRLKKIGTEAKESSDLLFSKIRLLSNNRVSTVNIQKTMSFIQRITSILTILKTIEDNISAGNISVAFITYERLRKLSIFDENEYKIIQLINLKLVSIKTTIKKSAVQLFNRWIDTVYVETPKIGKSILNHHEEIINSIWKLLERKESQRAIKIEDEHSHDAFDNSEIKFVWLYESYYIYRSLSIETDFIYHYESARKKQFDAIHDFQTKKRELGDVLSNILGYFVVEHHVQQTTEGIVSVFTLQQQWEESAGYLNTFATKYLNENQGMDYFLNTKDQMTYFIDAVKVYGYDAAPLITTLQNIFQKYSKRIAELQSDELKKQFFDTPFTQCQPTKDRHKEFMTIVEKTTNPNLKMISLPTCYSKAFYLCIDKIDPFIQELERYELKLNISLVSICDAIQEFIYELLKAYPYYLKANSKCNLQTGYQVIIDLEGFEKITPILVHLVKNGFYGRFAVDESEILNKFKIKDKIANNFKAVREWICQKYFELITNFIVRTDTSPSSSQNSPHVFVDQTITFTKNQFIQLTTLSSTVMGEIQTQMFQQLNHSLQNLILNATKTNIFFMEQYQLDIGEYESFCLSNPTFKSQVYTFVWCKQIASFFTSEHPEEYLNEEIRKKKYSKLLDKEQMIKLLSAFDLGAFSRNDPRKKLFTNVKNQLPKIKF
ncbi:Exocyst complex component EXOC6/Sec15 N-terminal domain-containing protein [Entamoeba marina]